MNSTWLITSELANKRAESTIHLCGYILKQLLDVVFVISRITKVEVRVISQSRMLRLITLTLTLIILDITETEVHNSIVLLYIEWKKWKSCFCFFTNGKQNKGCKLDIIMHDLECP